MSIPEHIIIASRKLRKNMTPSEKKIWSYIKDQKLGIKFLRQKPIHVFTEDNNYERYIIADFYCSYLKTIIEIDGDIHTDNEIEALDKVKEELLYNKGYRVMRFSNQEVSEDIDRVIKEISSLHGREDAGKADGMIDHRKKIKTFLNKPSHKQKLIVIYGPTGSGKTAMSIEIAKMLDSEIISTDSRQIFKYMDIGTGKITPKEMQGVPHHMIDIIDPSQEFSVGNFKAGALEIMERLYKEDKVPMLVGGTGLYIDSIIFDFELPGIPADPELRKQLDTLSKEDLYKRLEELDPEYASQLHPNNRPYIERALEVKILTGKSKSEYKKERKLLYDVLFLSPESLPEGEGTSYREWLYERINARVEMMFDAGAEAEVRELIEKGYSESDFGMNSIGYKEFFPYFAGKIEREEVITQIQQNSRNYAKRQLTWFRKYNDYQNNSQK